MITLLLALLLQAPAEQRPPIGPISDLIDNRIEAVAGRLEKTYAAEMGSLRDRISELREQAAAGAKERETILDRLRSAESDRQGFATRLTAMREALTDTRKDLRDARAEWRPLQNLADRLIALGWKLILVVVLFVILIEGTRLVAIWLLKRIAGTLPDLFKKQVTE